MDEDVESFDLELAPELVERAGDQASMDGADDLGPRLGDFVEGAAAHADFAFTCLRCESLLVEKLDDVALGLLVGDTPERERPSNEVAPPGATGLFCLGRAVVVLSDRPSEDGG